MDLLVAYSGVESDDSSSSDEPIDAGRDAADEDASGTCMLFKKDAFDLYRISERKTVERVVMHDVGACAQYLSTSEAGVAHVLEIDVTQCTDWFKDSPYTWGSPKGTAATMVDVGEKSKPYLAFFKTIQKMEEGGCSFEDEQGCSCGGTPRLVPGRGRRRAFVGCSDWRPGDPLKWSGGHMSCSLPHGMDEEKLFRWLENGVDGEETGEACCYIAGKRTKELSYL
ncbi:hypothetical protein I4F81_012197 [Pyropia yezoensis]|uniref:Uncharacterized protein n=1 Tax=Pyropia yezoensis TaxID=2788 RepID=A0ACC3CHJ2_PYRYE|nr:hypothetical protein I4F81_012197 [Neopyropia yezoensis]